MAAFDTLADALVDAVFAEFGDAAIGLTPADGSAATTVRADLERGTAEEVLSQGKLIRPAALVRVPYVDRPNLAKHDVIGPLDGSRWRICAAPDRRQHGAVWVAAVEDLGP